MPLPCNVCGVRPKMKGKHRCMWCWLRRQTQKVQLEMAEYRRTEWTGPPRMRVPESEWPDGHRWCAGCQAFIPLDYVRGSRCLAHARASRRRSQIKSTYGLDHEQYQALAAFQDHRCAICGNHQLVKELAVDHDHKTGEVRGLLCLTCNHKILGGAHDSALVLRRAVEYLERPPYHRMMET